MNNFASMWYGSELSKLERLTIQSYLANGYDFTLYAYDKDLKIPPGVIIKDAREILGEEKIYGKNGYWQPFSDMFRYKLLLETTHTWVDMDAICLRDDWNFGDYVMGLEPNHEYISKPNNAVLKFPPNSEALKYMYEYCVNFDQSEINWNPDNKGAPVNLGPKLLEDTIKKFNLEKYLQPEDTFYPVESHYSYTYFLGVPEITEKIKNMTKNSYVAHISNSGLNQDKNSFSEDSFLYYLAKKYKLESE